MKLLTFLPLLFVTESKKVNPDDGPVVVLYLEQWAVYKRDYFPSDLDKTVLQREMPYKQLQLLYSFFTPVPNECVLRSPDIFADAMKGDVDASYNVNSPYGDPAWGVASWLGAFPNFKARYPKMQFLPSLGGWSMSWAFTDCVRGDFAKVMTKSILDTIVALGFDGVDIDWEYPSCAEPCGCQMEATCLTSSNLSKPGDWAIYLTYLKDLRQQLDALGKKLGKSMNLSMAIGMNIHLLRGDNSKYTEPTPIKELCTIMDHINMMTYDFFGTWSGKTGPLAPLYENPAVDDDDDMHIDQSVKYVLSECGDKKRLNMGLATYGKAWKGVPKTGTPPGLWQTSSFTQGWQATNDLAETGGSTGTIPWFELYGTLMSRCTRTWDDASQTPTAFCDTNAKGEKDVFISFEDRESWSVKMKYARDNGMGGAIIWAASDMGNVRRKPEDMGRPLWNGLFQGWYGDKTINVKSINNLPGYKYSKWDYAYTSPRLGERVGLCPVGFWPKSESAGAWGKSQCDQNMVYDKGPIVTPDTNNAGNGGAGGSDVGDDGDVSPWTPPNQDPVDPWDGDSGASTAPGDPSTPAGGDSTGGDSTGGGGGDGVSISVPLSAISIIFFYNNL